MDKGDFSFFAFGDAGYTGDGNSLANVATAMWRFCDERGNERDIGRGCDFALVAGGNIYPRGADGAEDRSADMARFEAVFTDPLWESKGSKFAQAQALRDILLPTLCAHADAWFAGHQHTLEVHEVSCPAPGQPIATQEGVPAQNLPQKSLRKKLLHVVSGAVQ